MKKFILSMVAFMAVATTSFAQYFRVYQPCSSVSNYVPKVASGVPAVAYSIPSITSSTANINTTSVSGYSRSNGTYVQPHVRTMPNSTNWDNFSTRGNSNPFTSSTGFRARDYSNEAYNYGSRHTIHTGIRGGQYYFNSNGHKTYVPKRFTW